MIQSSENIAPRATQLQLALIARIVTLLRTHQVAVGDRLNELQLALQLGVSRSPVRAALQHLCQRGFIQREPNLGMRLVRLPDAVDVTGTVDADALLVRIARDRGQGRLEEQTSETELSRRYVIGRPIVRAALHRLADLEMIERKPGYGWRFRDTFRDDSARTESYRFRLVIEPAAIIEPGFRLPPAWAAEIRRRHERTLASQWTAASSVSFFEMNAAFHEGIAEASGNRWLSGAVRRQNQLRRLSNYDWTHGVARVQVNCCEHLAILDTLEAGLNAQAAHLMRTHLEAALRLQPSFNAA